MGPTLCFTKVSIHGGNQSHVSSRQGSKVQRTEVKVQRLAHIESIVSGSTLCFTKFECLLTKEYLEHTTGPN